MIARSFRYYVEGILAVFYGRRVLSFLRDDGLVILSVLAGVAVLVVLVYAIINRSKSRPIEVNAAGPVDQKALGDSKINTSK